jgi:hypothetical protein
MAYIDNSETKRELNDAIRGNAVSNVPSNQLSNFVQPVINVNPKDYQITNIISARASTGVHFLSSATEKTYITGVMLSGSSETVGNNYATVLVTPFGGTSTTVCAIHCLVNAGLTSQNDSIFVQFRDPILIQPSTNISLSVTGTLTAVRSTVFGYVTP